MAMSTICHDFYTTRTPKHKLKAHISPAVSARTRPRPNVTQTKPFSLTNTLKMPPLPLHLAATNHVLPEPYYVSRGEKWWHFHGGTVEGELERRRETARTYVVWKAEHPEKAARWEAKMLKKRDKKRAKERAERARRRELSRVGTRVLRFIKTILRNTFVL
jgi:hypothetical protein